MDLYSKNSDTKYIMFGITDSAALQRVCLSDVSDGQNMRQENYYWYLLLYCFLLYNCEYYTDDLVNTTELLVKDLCPQLYVKVSLLMLWKSS